MDGTLSVELVDHKVPGRVMARLGLDARLAHSRECDVLIIYSLSRLGRSTMATLGLLSSLRAREVSVVSTTEQMEAGSATER